MSWHIFFYKARFPNQNQKVKVESYPIRRFHDFIIQSKLRSYQLKILKALHGNIKYPVSSGIHTNGVFQTSCVLLRNRKGGFWKSHIFLCTFIVAKWENIVNICLSKLVFDCFFFLFQVRIGLHTYFSGPPLNQQWHNIYIGTESSLCLLSAPLNNLKR